MPEDYSPPIANKDTMNAYSGEVKRNSTGKSESGISPTNTITSKGRRASSTRRTPRKKA